MSLSSSMLAYGDCKEFLDQALDENKGARKAFRSEGHASYFRLRCSKFRQLDRDQNRTIYELGHKMHGQSEYDLLSLKIKFSTDGWHWVYAEKIVLEAGSVEPIPEDDVPLAIEGEANEVRLLEDQSDGNETSS